MFSYLLTTIYFSLSVVGTPFYLMDHIEGRVFKDPSLPDMSASERRDIYQATCDVLCRIHSVDIKEAGLQDYGKHGEWFSSSDLGVRRQSVQRSKPS